MKISIGRRGLLASGIAPGIALAIGAIIAIIAIIAIGCSGGAGDDASTEDRAPAPAATAPSESTSKAPPATPPSAPPRLAEVTPATRPVVAEAPPDTPVSAPDEPAEASATKADEMMSDYVGAFGEMSAALKSVTDEASAKAAAETIRDVVNRLKEMVPEWEAQPKSALAAASARHTTELERAQFEFATSLMPVMGNPAYASYVRDAIQGIPSFPSGR